MSKFAAAAFRHIPTGKIVATGNCHDVNALPCGGDQLQDYDEGFTDHSGQFYTREEAAQASPETELKLDGQTLHSEDLFASELLKSTKDYDIEAPERVGNSYRINIRHVPTGKSAGSVTFLANANVDRNHPHFGYHQIQQADVGLQHQKRGLYGRMLQAASGFVKHTLKSKGLVSDGAWRSEAATGAWDKLASKVPVRRLPGKEPDAPDLFMSEKNDDEFSEHEWLIALKMWLQRRSLRKDESELINYVGESLGGITADDHAVAHSMLARGPLAYPEFRAAKFMANFVKVSPQALRAALFAYEHDLEMAALFAYNLPRSEEARSTLRGVMALQSLEKSDLDVAAIPRLVDSKFQEASAYVEMVQRAFADGAVHQIKLDGKHSKGAAVAIDPESKEKLLLKPGSGGVSPAAGVAQETASQTRREAAAYYLSVFMGVDEFVPHCDVVSVDGEEVACVELLVGCKSLDERTRDPDFNRKQVLDTYVQNGDLFKWAVFDFIIGNADRHAANVLINRDDEIHLIDYGSAFAGSGYEPGADSKSFIPAYLRSRWADNIKAKPPEERYEELFHPTHEVAKEVGRWIESLDYKMVEGVLTRYGIHPHPTLARLQSLKAVEESRRIEYVLRFFCGEAPIS
jgi:hypothetical protein